MNLLYNNHLFVKVTKKTLNNSGNHYKYDRILVLNTINGVKVSHFLKKNSLCWNKVNGSPCVCLECWSCKRKLHYDSPKIASKKANSASRRTRSKIVPYQCDFCGLFHIGHTRKYRKGA